MAHKFEPGVLKQRNVSNMQISGSRRVKSGKLKASGRGRQQKKGAIRGLLMPSGGLKVNLDCTVSCQLVS